MICIPGREVCGCQLPPPHILCSQNQSQFWIAEVLFTQPLSGPPSLQASSCPLCYTPDCTHFFALRQQTGSWLPEPLDSGNFQFSFCRRGHRAHTQVPGSSACLLPLTQSWAWPGGVEGEHPSCTDSPGKGSTSQCWPGRGLPARIPALSHGWSESKLANLLSRH